MRPVFAASLIDNIQKAAQCERLSLIKGFWGHIVNYNQIAKRIELVKHFKEKPVFNRILFIEKL
jgi:hypothetical protein